MDWFGTVDEYLYSVGRIGLEQVLCEGCLSGGVPPAVAGYARITRELMSRSLEADGGAHEAYGGTLAIAEVRYQFLCHIFIDADGSHFVSHIAHFEPVEWSVRMAVA
ncbi:MAG TPA: hypothetical protein VKY65_16045 [Alphaproteobacteria bacterium]|nr:hypothetical protein [Alphaproteobacteria bacterium]